MKELFIRFEDSIELALKKFTDTSSNTLIVVNNNNSYLGTISNGDVRKEILKKKKLTRKIKYVFNKNSTFYYINNYHEEEISKSFLENNFDIIPILNNKKKVIKVIKLLDFLKNRTKTNKDKIKKIDKSIKKINVVIMAGGLGTRMAPFTEVLPKPLIPIQGKPVINRIIDNFNEYGLKNLWLTINFKGQLLKSYLNETKYKKNIKYYEEKRRLGTVGALKFIKKKLSKFFILTNCDTIIKTDYSKVVTFHKKNNFDITIISTLKDFDIPYGVCKIDANNNFINLEEKPNIKMLVNSGMYVMKKNIIDFIPSRKFDMNDLLLKLKTAKKKIGVYSVSSDSWIDVGNWEEYHKAINSFKD